MSPHRTPHIPKHPGENTHTKTSSHPKISSCFQIQRRGCPRGRRARPLEYTAPAATAERFSPLTKGVKNNHESSSSSSKRRRTIPGNRITKGAVKIRVRYSGICGSDIPRVLNNGVHFYPIVLGHEFSGDVVEVGEGVTKVKVGDRVSGAPLLPCMKCDDCQQGNFSLCKHYSFIGSRQQGSNADYVVVPEQNAVPFDKSVSYEQGAMFEPATVAIHGVFQNDYHGGEYVAILGGGTVGMFTMQWTKIFGSRKVVVFDISDERLDLAKRLGADEVINTKEEGYMEKAMAITGGKGYGFVFETAGQVPTMHMAFELAANKAHVCFIGTPHENLTFTPAQWENMNRIEFKLTGSWMSYSAPFPGREWDLTAHYFATGQLKFDPGFIYKKIPMSQAQEAFQLFKTPGLVKGKILLSNEEE